MEPRSCILLGLLAGTLAGPINYYSENDDTSCARQCAASNKFKYQVGVTYEFDYGVITRTAMAGASEDHASLQISAAAQIHVLNPCDFSLTLNDVIIKRSNPESPRNLENVDHTGQFRNSLEANPLRFSFQDGVIEELCPEYDESKWSLNIKRGVLSMFQNTMNDLKKDERVREDDVTGTCDTDYRVSQKGWYSINIKKSKNLLGCTGRHGYKTSVQTSSYRVPHSIQSLPLMKSIHDCDQEITSEGILKKSACHEMHVFRPFSKDNNGAVTEANQRLEFTRTLNTRSRRNDIITQRTTMIFDHTFEHRGEVQSVHDATSKLREICEATVIDIRPEVPRLFSDLVYIMKNMESSWLQSIYNDVTDGNLCPNNRKRLRKFFLDALPMVGTSDSLHVIRELIAQKAVTKQQTELWLTSFAFIANPNKAMFAEVVPLLGERTSETSMKALLSISAMLNNYCELNSQCLEEYEISNIISALDMNIGYTCDASDDRQKQLKMLTLRAIGNTGRSSRLLETLKKCYHGNDIPIEVRIAALQGFRRMPCSFDREPVKDIFVNEEEDAEIRIAAYLTIMQCPDIKTMQLVKSRLETEHVNQVGSFIWSHLTNLMETSNPHKQAIREILEDETLQRNFDMDKRKFSRNYEGSFFFDKFNTGAMVESNIIWSPKSFVPRSANLNLTVDLFGKSINLLEFGGRIEGVEYLLESYLGPEGLFRPPGKPTEYHKSRGIKMEKLERIKGKYDSVKDELKGAMYMRFFGNELRYSSFNGLDDKRGSDSKFNILEHLIKLSKDHDTDFTQNIMFMDSSIIIPTGSGIPLNLTVNGTASIIVKATGSVDLRKLATKPRSLHIHGSVLPSAAVEVSSSMSMDAFVTKTGIKMTSMLHTSTALTGSLDLSRGQIFSLELDTPKQKMEIFDVKSKYFIIHDRFEKEQKMIQENRREKKLCSGNRLKTITGLEVCGEVSYPNASMNGNTPYFPFTGPVTMSLSLSKQDIPNGFQIIAKKIQSKEATLVQLALNTPGSQTNRALSLDFTLNHKLKELKASIISPWKKATLEGSLQNDRDKKGVNLILLNENDEYAIESSVNIAKNRQVTTYTPLVEFRRPQTERISLKGTVVSDNNEEIEADLKLSGATERVVNMKGKYVNMKKIKSVTGSVALSPKEVYSAVATVIIDHKKTSMMKILPTFLIKTPQGALVSLTGSADYKTDKSLKTDLTLEMDQVLKEPIKFKASVTKNVSPKKGSVIMKIRSSASLTCQAIILKTTSYTILKKNKKAKTLSTRFGVDYDILSTTKKNKISFSSKLIDRSTSSLNKYTGNVNMDVKYNPEYNVNVDLDLNHNIRHSEVDMKVRHGKNIKDKKDKSQELYVSGTVNHKIDLPAAIVNFVVKAVYPPKKVDYHIKGKHEQGKKFLDSEVKIKYSSDNNINITLSLKNESKAFLKMAGNFALDYPGREFRISTDLTQRQKVDYFHSFNVQLNKDQRYMISSTYRNPGSSSLHEIISDIQLYDQIPMKFTGAVNLKLKKFTLETLLDRDGKQYGVDVTSDIRTTDPSGKWTLYLKCPHRHFTALLEGGKHGKKYIGKFDTSWDANKDRSQRITADAAFNFQKDWQNVKLGGNIDITTPFKPFQQMSVTYDYSDNIFRYSSIGKITWDRKVISTDVKIAKPISKNNFNVSMIVSTPFQGYRTIQLDLGHSLQPHGILSSSMRASCDVHYLEAVISGHIHVSKLIRDVKGTAILKTSIDKYKSFMLTGEHKDDLHKFTTKSTFELNDEIYDLNHDMMLSRVGWYIQGSGKTILTSPKCRVIVNWNHYSNKSTLKTTLTSEWGFEGEKFHIDLHSNHQFGIRRNINSGLIIQSPWEPVQDIEIATSHDFGEGYAKRNIYYKQNKRIKASLRYNYERNSKGIDFDFYHNNPYMEDIFGNLNTRPSETTKTGHMEVTWAPRQKIMLDGSFTSQAKEYYDGEMRISTPFKGFESMVGHFEHDKVSSVWVSKANVEYGFNKKVEVETNIGFDKIKKLGLSVKTPYQEMSHFEGSMQYSGNVKAFKSQANIKIIPVLENMGVELKWNAKKDFNGNFKLVSPFERAELLDITALSKTVEQGRKSTLEIAYRKNNNKIIFDNMYNLKNWTNFKIGFTLDTPFIQMTHMEADTSFLYQNGRVEADASLKTPFKRFEDLQMELKHSNAYKQAQTYILLKYSPRKHFTADAKFGWADAIHGEVTVKTPYENYEITQLNFKHDGPPTKFQTHADLSYANKKIISDLKFVNVDGVQGIFTFSSPFSNFKNVQAEFSSEGELKNFKATGTLNFGDIPKVITTSLAHTSQKKLFRVDFDLQTPYLEDIKLSVNHNGKPERFTTKISATSGKKYHLDSIVEFNEKKQSLSTNTEIGYIFKGKGRQFSFQFKGDGEPQKFNFDLSGTYDNRNLNLTTSFSTEGTSMSGSVDIKTPFEGYRNLGLSFDHHGPWHKFKSSGILKLVNNTEYRGSVSMDIPDVKHIDAVVELYFPIDGLYPLNKVYYRHNIGDQQADVNAEVIYKGINRLAAAVNTKMSPLKEFSIKIESPFKDYRTIIGSVSYEEYFKVHKVNGRFKVENDVEIGVISKLDLSTVPILFSVTIDTPYSGFEKIDITASHQGDHTNFMTSASFDSPKTKRMSATTSFKYFSPNEMEGEATFKSSLQNFTDIKLILRQAVRNGFHEKQVEVGWAPGKEIFIDGSYKFENNWRGQQINGQFHLKTPFDVLKDVHAKLDHTHAKELLTDVASAEYNGKTYLDVMSRYSVSVSNKRNYRIDIKEPRPMLLTISGKLDKDNVDVDAYINWNKNDADSNFKLLTLFKNKPHLSDLERNYKFKLVHPVRTMGFEGNFINNKQMYKSQALVTWDEKKGNTFSYDVQMHNKTTRYRKDYDASVKFGVPMRSVKMTSGYSDGRGIRSYDYAIFWDVDRDQSKQVGAKVSVESERPLKKLDLILLLPSIDKTYKLSTEVSKDVGSTMFYGKSEFSYHPNPIHNLVLSARLEDVAISQTGKNYSLSMSLSHPVTGVNVVMTSHVCKTDSKASAGTEVLYLASDRQNKNFALRGEIDQLRKMLNFEILSPIKSVEIRGEATPGIPYRLQLFNTFDQQKHVTIDLLVDSNKKELDLTMNYDPDDPSSYININGHYVNSTFIQAAIFRQDGHDRVSEGTVALRLNTSHILHTRLTWRPTIIPEIQQLISNKIQTNVYIMNNVYNGASQAVGNELRMKYSAVSREMGLEMAPLMHFMDTEIKSMEGQLKAISRELKRAYDRNDLHIKDMGRTINEWFTEVLTAYQELVSEFKVSYKELEEVMKEVSNVIQKYPLREKYREMVNQGVGLIRQYQQIFTARINDLMYKSDELSAALYAKYRATTRHLQRKLHETTRIITENPHISFIHDKYNEIKNKFDYFPDIDLGKLAGAVDNGIQSSLSPQMTDTYKSIVYNTRSIIKAQVQDLMKQKEFKQLHDLSKEMHAQAVWAYKYLDVKENFKAAMMKTFDLTKEFLFEELNNLKEGLVNLKKSRVIVFDTQHGEIQFELYLPIPLKSLQDPPHLGIKNYIRKMQNFVTNYLPSKKSFWDVYYQSRLGTDDVRTWLPPFRAYASVLGDQHYVTFDQHHFDFAGRCSYVLARDMVDDNFTIVMNYDNNAEQKSIMVLLKGLTIEVFSNNQVSANNRKVELPFVSESVSVVSNQGIIKIDNGHGLTVDCYTKHEIYTIGLPGWYFGKIAGLLGSYDNEDSNDMMTAEKKITKDIQIFASSWEIGRRRCLTENNARDIQKIEIPECSHLFTESSSPFSSCFGQVKPELFEEACIDYIQNKRLTDGKCRAARQYIGVCKNHGVNLNMLDDCVTCQGPNGDFKQGSIVNLNSESVDAKKRTPRSADIILIVEEKQCNNGPVKILPGIVTQLEETLKQAGIINNRYGLIGYGGDNTLHTEHINTIDGGEFAEAGVFLKGTENLRLSNSTLAADNQAAIRLATEYPYRMGVSKILILMPCSICEFNIKHIDMDSLLKTQGFTLHILRQENFTLPIDATFKGTTIYGMDQFTAHTKKPENQASVFSAITKPTDACANLAFHTNGSLFDVSHLITSNLQVQRQRHFISAFVNYINDAAIPPSCQVCECQTNRLMNARTVCRPCEHSFSLWNYIPRWWSEQDDIKHGVYKNQLQGFIEAVKKTKDMDVKSL